MMVKALLYGYCTGWPPPVALPSVSTRTFGFRVLAANNTPDFRTVSDFRKDHLQALGGLFLQALALCQQAGLVKLGHVALDGTKVRANASRNKAMSYGRMKEKEAQLKAEVAELLRKAGRVDDDEDHRYGRDKRGDELPEELAFRESRLRKIREARRRWRPKPWRRRSRLRGKEGIIPGCLMTSAAELHRPGLPHHARPGRAGLPAVQLARRWWTAPTRSLWRLGHRPTLDKRQAVVMVEETIGNVGAAPKEVSADAGYYSAKAVDGLYDLGVDPFVAPGEDPPRPGVGASAPGRYPRASHPGTGCAASCVRSGAGSATRSGWRRWNRVRPDQAGPGLRQFLLRGLEKVNSEWSLICTGHNLLKLFRFGEGKPGKARATGPAGNNRTGTGLQPAGYSDY